MTYLVTGATGFIGRRLVQKLLEREGKVYFLVLERELDRLDPLYERWGVDRSRAVPVVGDLREPFMGVSEPDREMLKGKVRHMFHLAAIYDLKASAEVQQAVNVQGTRNAVGLAAAVEAGCFHLTSSIASAGLYEGVFLEEMFEEAEGLEHPYYRTKHDSERVVREECTVPWRVYRPGIVVGHSETGEMDKVDGPYYFFKLIQKLRSVLPPWMPTIGLEGGRINIVPVNFVVDAMDHIAHKDALDGKCFHLTDPNPERVGDMLNIFARSAHAPQMAMRVNAHIFNFIPSYIKNMLGMFPPVQRMTQQVLDGLGIPRDVLQFINYPTRFDCRETLKALADSDIHCPPLRSYSDRIWDYWERNLDPDLFVDRSLTGLVTGKTVMVTGASSGIGRAAALKLAHSGAHVLIVARGEEKLLETRAEIEAQGGKCTHYTADLSDMADCDRLVAKVLEEQSCVDILVNNAGRSIRRSVALSFDRFHDFERTMQLNYFGCLRLTMGLLPAMIRKRRGHVINISSIGVLTNAPRFSAYVASKAALESFSRCAAPEFADMGIDFTNINMPLVRTPMIAPTKIYQNVPTISPDEAADMVGEAIIYRPKRIATRLGIAMQVAYALAPKLVDVVMNTAFRLFPDSAAAKGGPEEAAETSSEQMAFASLMRGIHW